MVDFLRNTGKLPNILSTLRLLVAWIPLWILLATPGTLGWRLLGMTVFIIIAATDALDGYLARRWNQTSIYGKVVDPLADKLLVGLTLGGLCVVSLPNLPHSSSAITIPLSWLLFALIIGREIAVSIVRYLKKRRKDLIIPANGDGKMKMIYQSLGIIVAFLPISEFVLVAWSMLLISLHYSWRSAKAYIRA